MIASSQIGIDDAIEFVAQDLQAIDVDEVLADSSDG